MTDRGPERPDWLRAGLDDELAGVSSRPGALGDVLREARRAQTRQPWWRRTGPVPPWFVAATAVLVVALAVPVLTTALGGRDEQPPDSLAASPLALPTSVATRSPAPPSALAAPPPPVLRTSPPTRRPTPTRAPAAAPTSPPAASPAAPRTCGALTAPGGGGARVDLDGDGRPDVLSLADGRLTVALAAGGTASTPFSTSSPYVSVLPVQAPSSAPQVLVITRGAVGDDGSVGQNAVLYALADCALGPVLNAQGGPYTFEVGSSRSDDVRSGVACDAAGLVGTTATRGTDAWTVTSTPVRTSAGAARNGTPTASTVPLTGPDADALATATCGSAVPQELG